jgi:hypothetical protein
MSDERRRLSPDEIRQLEAEADAYELDARRQSQAATGWRCPVCGGGMSPYATRCPCTPEQPIVNVGTSTGVIKYNANDDTFESTIPVARDDTTGIG